MNKHNLLLAFYGDDFTGSTDALEFLCNAGARTVLFIDPPTAEQLNAYSSLDAIGVAGLTRSMPPEQMEPLLQQAFQSLKQLKPQHVHYKVCSTFDSSPATGSIGKAMDVGSAVFNNKFIPLLVAAPSLGRYCLFGNLFARFGTSGNGNIYRLDRHPSMSRHPVTPADESDLRLHLAKQTNKKTGLIDILTITQSSSVIKKTAEQLLEEQNEVILFDALEEDQLINIAELMEAYRDKEEPLFSVGSSGIEMALGKYWHRQHLLNPVASWPSPGSVDQLLVASGSCSPVTAAQTEWALQNGFKELIIDVDDLLNEQGIERTSDHITDSAIALIKDGYSLVIHTNGAASSGKAITGSVSASLTGTLLGNIVRAVVAATGIERIVIAGGDSSSYAARAMGIEAVEMIASLVKGAPLCKAIAPGSPINGKQVNFKGGQVGGEDYFGRMKKF